MVTNPETTNNRMELSAVIEALKVIKRNCPITIFTDSQYVKRGITEWIDGWIKNWKNVKNVDLWQELYPLSKQYNIDWQWVRGHNGDKYNERADELANLAILSSTKWINNNTMRQLNGVIMSPIHCFLMIFFFSQASGIEEKRYVFHQHNNLAERFAKLKRERCL